MKTPAIPLQRLVVVNNLVLKYGTDVVSNLQTVVWLGLPESFVHNLALSFAHNLTNTSVVSRLSERGVGGCCRHVDSKVNA